MSELAICGGPRAITCDIGDLFEWPIFTEEDEEAVLALMRGRPNFASPEYGDLDNDIVAAFEREFAAWCDVEFAIAHSNGTAAIQAAMFACGVGHGDEVITPSATYWAAVLPCFSLGATPVFADIDRLTLNIDPGDIEHRITDRTKAIVVVHQLGYPAEMDEIVRIAKRYRIKVIEDASHAHGTLYKGRKAGTLGDVAVFSLCGKPIAVGEGGMLVTDCRGIYERVIAWCHNFSFNEAYVRDPHLLTYQGLPMGGVTARMHNLSAAIGRTQLRHYDARMREIDRAMNYFWDNLSDVEGIIAHRPVAGSGSTMGGWYTPHGIYDKGRFGGLPLTTFAQAVIAEGFNTETTTCLREPLHLHPLLNTCDVYNQGRPTRIANSGRDTRQGWGSLPTTENIAAFTVPPFRHFRPHQIEQYAACFRKVAQHYKDALDHVPTSHLASMA